MIISRLAEYSHLRHSRDTACPSCPNECLGGCEECLDAIHFDRISRVYNCSNITHFYVCKYIYKYSSEIDHLFSRLKSIHSFPSYNIMSIGCGPCTELIGVLNYMERENQLKNVTYLGFDNNKIWKEIHDYLLDIMGELTIDVNLRFVYADVFKIIERLDLSNLNWKPNIVFLQYVLSDMVKGHCNIRSFLDNLVSKVVPFMPIDSYIIVNDINHYKARDYFDYLASSVSALYKTWVYKAHFKNNIRKEYQYGWKRDSNELTSPIPDHIQTKYNPWSFCSSAQIVIKKRSIE